MMVSFLLGKQNFSFIIEGRTGEKQWGCPLTAVRWVLGCIPKREKRGAADAARSSVYRYRRFIVKEKKRHRK